MTGSHTVVIGSRTVVIDSRTVVIRSHTVVTGCRMVGAGSCTICGIDRMVWEVELKRMKGCSHAVGLSQDEWCDRTYVVAWKDYMEYADCIMTRY